MPTRCQQVMRQVCEAFGAQLREFHGEPDHVHLLVHHPPTFALSRLVNSLKGVSSRRLWQEHVRRIHPARTAGHVGAPSHLAASAGGAPCRSSRSTSVDRNVPTEAGQALPPGPQGPGFRAQILR